MEVGVGEDEGEEVLPDEEFAGEGGDEASSGAEAGEEEGGGGGFWFSGGEEGQAQEEHDHVDDGIGEAEVFFGEGFGEFAGSLCSLEEAVEIGGAHEGFIV